MRLDRWMGVYVVVTTTGGADLGEDARLNVVLTKANVNGRVGNRGTGVRGTPSLSASACARDRSLLEIVLCSYSAKHVFASVIGSISTLCCVISPMYTALS